MKNRYTEGIYEKIDWKCPSCKVMQKNKKIMTSMPLIGRQYKHKTYFTCDNCGKNFLWHDGEFSINKYTRLINSAIVFKSPRIMTSMDINNHEHRFIGYCKLGKNYAKCPYHQLYKGCNHNGEYFKEFGIEHIKYKLCKWFVRDIFKENQEEVNRLKMIKHINDYYHQYTGIYYQWFKYGD